MINTRHNYKLCKKCNRGYLNKCNTSSCKYTIENYRGSSKYMKKKIIEYLKENKIEFYMCRICSEIVDKNILNQKNIPINLILYVKLKLINL